MIPKRTFSPYTVCEISVFGNKILPDGASKNNTETVILVVLETNLPVLTVTIPE